MRFLFKLFVLGFLGLAFLPAVAPSEYRLNAQSDDTAEAPSAFAVAALVGQAVADVRGICERQPQVCETGRDVIEYTGSKAREGLVIAYAMFRHGHPSMRDAADQAPEASADAG